MRIEIDTSSRLDQSGETVFAFSNHIQKAIVIKQKTRDQALNQFIGKNLKRELRLFSACIYYLIEDHLKMLQEIKIDQEYPGHENEIKWIILNIIKKQNPKSKAIIRFENIGKKSQAHKVAWKTLRKERKAERVISSQEILSILFK